MKPTSSLLRKAREFYAATPSHAPCDESPEPGTVCVIYALSEASIWARGGYHEALRALERSVEIPRTVSVPEWNARHTTAVVLAGFDKAIADAQAAEAEFSVTDLPARLSELTLV